MRKFLPIVIFLLCVIPAVHAQDGAEGRLGLHLNTNQPSRDWNNVGLNGQLGYTYHGVRFLADGYGSDNANARTRYSVDYAVPVKVNGASFKLGAGYYRFGLQNGVFGQLAVNYEKYDGLLRFGGSRMADAEVAYHLADLGRFSLHPTYRYTRQEVNSTRFHFHQFGFALRFKEKQ